jgi:hypothetical protein
LFTVDEDKIIEEITKAGVSPQAAEAGAQLVDDWIRRNQAYDLKHKTLAVEMGFVVWPDDNTLVIGVQDRVAQDAKGVFGSEWKSTKAESRYWNEAKWLDSISNGSQLATYAWALRDGIFLERNVSGGEPHALQFNVENPRIMVRAAVKERPTRFWPYNPEDAFYEFSAKDIEFTKNAYINMAEEIRALRKTKLYPWQLTGIQCDAFFKKCGFFGLCSKNDHPIGTPKALFDPHDPAAKMALAFVDSKLLANPDLVILSASSYATAASCKEKFRLISGALGDKEEDMALGIGTAMHAGLGEYYRQMKEFQK